MINFLILLIFCSVFIDMCSILTRDQLKESLTLSTYKTNFIDENDLHYHR